MSETKRALTEAFNATWQHRSEFTPVIAPTRDPGLLDVWSLLPHTICGKCGVPRCMAFAASLLQQASRPDPCPALRDDLPFADNRSALGVMAEAPLHPGPEPSPGLGESSDSHARSAEPSRARC
jgi:ArsR family metal-binding transcriptional regulator